MGHIFQRYQKTWLRNRKQFFVYKPWLEWYWNWTSWNSPLQVSRIHGFQMQKMIDLFIGIVFPVSIKLKKKFQNWYLRNWSLFLELIETLTILNSLKFARIYNLVHNRNIWVISVLLYNQISRSTVRFPFPWTCSFGMSLNITFFRVQRRLSSWLKISLKLLSKIIQPFLYSPHNLLKVMLSAKIEIFPSPGTLIPHYQPTDHQRTFRPCWRSSNVYTYSSIVPRSRMPSHEYTPYPSCLFRLIALHEPTRAGAHTSQMTQAYASIIFLRFWRSARERESFRGKRAADLHYAR